MPRFLIQLRAPGDPSDPMVPWETVSVVMADSAPAAIQQYVAHQNWVNVMWNHHAATVPGVGMFRAMPGEEAAVRPFVVQRQEQPGPGDRHIVWTAVARIEAADVSSAIRLYCEQMRLGSVSVDAPVFRPYGMGLFRVVPAESADAMGLTPAP